MFLSSLFQNEKMHQGSKDFFKKIESDSEKFCIVISILTLFEIFQSYYRKTKSKKGLEALQESFIDLNLSKKLRIFNLEASFLAYFVTYHDLFDLKTSDTVIALIAHREKVPLITWDSDLIRRCKGKIKTYTPQEFLNSL